MTTNEDEVYNEVERVISDSKIKLSSFAAYSPGDLEELDNIVEEVNEELEYLKDIILRCGRASVIAELTEEGFEITEE